MLMKKSLLATLVLVGLTACSSGGGGSNNDNGTQTNHIDQAVSATPNTTAQPATPTAPSSNAENKTGGVIVIKDQHPNVNVSVQPLANGSINEIIVEGKTLPVQHPGIYSGGWTAIQSTQVCCGKYSSVRFGILDNPIQDGSETSYIFYNGIVTKEMPTSGIANYIGDVVITGNNQAFAEEGWLRGKSTFEADFTTKQLKGNFEVENLAPITVNATINGASFDGSASSSDFASQTTVEGKFYGRQASELGGLFLDRTSATPEWGGAFGARQ